MSSPQTVMRWISESMSCSLLTYSVTSSVYRRWLVLILHLLEFFSVWKTKHRQRKVYKAVSCQSKWTIVVKTLLQSPDVLFSTSWCFGSVLLFSMPFGPVLIYWLMCRLSLVAIMLESSFHVVERQVTGWQLDGVSSLSSMWKSHSSLAPPSQPAFVLS